MASQWAEKDREQALQALVLANGNTVTAAKHLKASGLSVPDRTIRDWRDEYADKYETLEKTRDDWTARYMADHAEALSALFGELEARYALALLDRPDEELRRLSPSVIAAAMNKATVSRSLSIQRANELRQRPTKPVGDVMSFKEALGALQAFSRKHPGIFQAPQLIEGEAEEIEDA